MAVRFKFSFYIFIALSTFIIGCKYSNSKNTQQSDDNQIALSFSQAKRDSILKDYNEGYYRAETESNQRFPYESLSQEASKSIDGQRKYTEMYNNNVKCYNDIIADNNATIFSKYKINIDIIYAIESLKSKQEDIEHPANNNLNSELKSKIYYAYSYYQLRADRESKEDHSKSFEKLWDEYNSDILTKFHISATQLGEILKEKVNTMASSKDWKDDHFTEQEYYQMMQ